MVTSPQNHKRLLLLVICILVVSLIATTNCTVPAPAPTPTPPAPTPTPTPPPTPQEPAPTPLVQYRLTISTTTGGSVTAPGVGPSTYDAGTVVSIVAEAEEGYKFMNWTGHVDTIADVNAASTTITVNRHRSITANFAKEIRDWHDLHAIRDNLGGSYVLINDLDSTTAGYEELASETANEGKGWQPIGTLLAGPLLWDIVDAVEQFSGSFNGQGYEIRGLFINRPEEDGVGLFGFVDEGGVVEHLGVVNAEVTGGFYVGGLVGWNSGTVSNSYSTVSVAGDSTVGGLVGWNGWEATVASSYSSGSVTGTGNVGGLVGHNYGTVTNSYSSASVTAANGVGGLVGTHGWGTVSNSYSSGSVAGEWTVGGLVGSYNWGTVSNSYYNCDEVLINGENIITIGALFAEDFEQWLANDKFLDVNERLSRENGYYVINNVSDFKELLAFGQDDSLKFRLKNDLDLGSDPNFYIPYLGAEFDGNGHQISNLRLNFDFLGQVGLFGYLASGGKVSQVGVENANITGFESVGGLVGWNDGTVSNSSVTGSMSAGWSVGGLVGTLHTGTVSNSYSRASVAGDSIGNAAGGLVGWNYFGTVSNSYYNCDEVSINGEKIITTGALFGEDFEEWLANDKFLDVNERLSREDGYYLINDVDDFKQLLAFGQDDSLKFRLKNDLDLGNDSNFYIPYLAGEFDGYNHKISNLVVNLDFLSQVGLFGYLASGGKVSQVGVENANITGYLAVGGLVGYTHYGIVSNSYASGSVTGTGYEGYVGGLVGQSYIGGTVSNSYSSGSVSGNREVGGLVGSNRYGQVHNSYSSASVAGNEFVGGLVGVNRDGTVSKSHATGSVAGNEFVGGLVGHNPGTVINSFWDVETSGTQESDGGTGKTTAEMKSITTFKATAWHIAAVAPGLTDPDYIWNIVDGESYPFLSWELVS